MADASEEAAYGGELPEEVEPEAAAEEEPVAEGAEGDEGEAKGEGEEDLEAMKQRLKEMEDEAAKLREMQAKVEKEMGGEGDANASQVSREEVDARSVYVGNVDYACTPEELQRHFQSCGTVNRVTIMTDKMGNTKGFAYIEFLEPDAVASALLLADSELRGRQLKVAAKRTNVPGMKAFRGRGRGRGFHPYSRGYGFRGGFRGRGRGGFRGRGGYY